MTSTPLRRALDEDVRVASNERLPQRVNPARGFEVNVSEERQWPTLTSAGADEISNERGSRLRPAAPSGWVTAIRSGRSSATSTAAWPCGVRVPMRSTSAWTMGSGTATGTDQLRTSVRELGHFPALYLRRHNTVYWRSQASSLQLQVT